MWFAIPYKRRKCVELVNHEGTDLEWDEGFRDILNMAKYIFFRLYYIICGLLGHMA